MFQFNKEKLKTDICQCKCKKTKPTNKTKQKTNKKNPNYLKITKCSSFFCSSYQSVSALAVRRVQRGGSRNQTNMVLLLFSGLFVTKQSTTVRWGKLCSSTNSQARVRSSFLLRDAGLSSHMALLFIVQENLIF